MKIFVSSTCYDLLDLRAELYEDLRAVGVECLFSDFKESDFTVLDQATINSIENCLVNVRSCDKFVLVLSQRYGPILGGQFGPFSATHLEYEEAKARKTPMIVHVRDRLVAEWTAWRKNGKKADFQTTWAQKDDAQSLFNFLEQHQKLHRAGGSADENNWFTIFRTAVDLRTDLRRRLAPEIFRETAEKLARAGQVPIIVVVGQGLQLNNPQSEKPFYRFSFDLVNAGPVPALAVVGRLRIPPSGEFYGNDSTVGAVLSGDDRTSCGRISFDVPKPTMDVLLAAPRDNQVELHCRLVIAYTTPACCAMEDHVLLCVDTRSAELSFATSPHYQGKRIVDQKDLLLPL